MKKSWSIFLVISLVLFIIGASVALIGFISGADTARIASIAEARLYLPFFESFFV